MPGLSIWPRVGIRCGTGAESEAIEASASNPQAWAPSVAGSVSTGWGISLGLTHVVGYNRPCGVATGADSSDAPSWGFVTVDSPITDTKTVCPKGLHHARVRETILLSANRTGALPKTGSRDSRPDGDVRSKQGSAGRLVEIGPATRGCNRPGRGI